MEGGGAVAGEAQSIGRGALLHSVSFRKEVACLNLRFPPALECLLTFGASALRMKGHLRNTAGLFRAYIPAVCTGNQQEQAECVAPPQASLSLLSIYKGQCFRECTLKNECCFQKFPGLPLFLLEREMKKPILVEVAVE